MATTTTNTTYSVIADTLTTESGISIEGGSLHVYNDELKVHLNGALKTVATTDIVPTSYTETIVNISSAQILAMGSSPVELLPAPGAGKYYDIDKVILEYTHVTTAYSATDEYVDFNYGNLPFCSLTSLIGISSNNAQIVNSLVNNYDSITVGGLVVINTPINQSVIFGTLSGNDPTLGDGTLRVKIYHKTITFGA